MTEPADPLTGGAAVGAAGPFTLIQRPVQSSAGIREIWHIVAWPDGVRLFIVDDDRRLLMQRRPSPPDDLGSAVWTLPGHDMTGVAPEVAASQLVEGLSLTALRMSVSGISQGSATTRHRITFVEVHTARRDVARPVLSWISTDQVFALLRSGAVRDDRIARRIYDWLPLRMREPATLRHAECAMRPGGPRFKISPATLVRTFGIFEIHKADEDAAGDDAFQGYVVARRDGVRVIALDSRASIVLTREYRDEYGEADWRLPGGKVGDGEGLLEAAKRELSSETGYSASTWKQVYTSHDEAGSRYVLVYFMCSELQPGAQQLHGTEVITEVVACSQRDVFEKLRSGEIREDRSARVLYELLPMRLAETT